MRAKKSKTAADVARYYHKSGHEVRDFPENPEVVRGRVLETDGMLDIESDEYKGRLDLVVKEVNAQLVYMKSPVSVVAVPEIGGYGLISIRNIKIGEVITTYGGIIHEGSWQPDKTKGESDEYAIYDRDIKRTWDARRYFYPRDAGRWINEPPLGIREWANVRARVLEKNPFQYIFEAKKDIPANTEVWLDYGAQEYNRESYGIEDILRIGNKERLKKALGDIEKYIRMYREVGDSVKVRTLETYKRAVLELLSVLQTKCNFCSVNDAQDRFDAHGGRFCSQACQATWVQFFK
jgi:hypothetical protein